VSDRIEQTTERILSGAAIIIAIIAAVTAIYQTRILRDQARASVWPYLMQYYSTKDGYTRIVENAGLGPAVIRSFEVLVDSQPTKSWPEVIQKLGFDQNQKMHLWTSYIGAGTVIPVGAKIETVRDPNPADNDTLRTLMGYHVEVRLCFCSIYGDCWQLRGGSEPQRVKACTYDPARQFRQP
jgi:hypothetical protein